MVEALQGDGAVLHDLFDVIAGIEAVLVAERYGLAELGAVHEARSRLKDGDAGALRADQGACDVEAVLRHELSQIVAGAAAGDLRVALPDEIGVLVAQVP